ncbi:MAG: L,D-transpeptidase family protein [Terrisporobacter sp.]
MKKQIKKYLAVMLTLVLVLINTASPSYAESGHLLIANSKTNKMAYYINNKFVREFRISTGRLSTPTPQGKVKIVNKIKNRPYYAGGIPGGSPKNPLGDRWLGLHINGTYGTTYGIHGNNNENSIGKNITDGCIRMHNKEVRWLFDRIENQSDVIINYSNDSYSKIAAKYGIKIGDSQEEKKPGWEKSGNDWYYVKEDKTYQKNGWIKIKEQWYYFDSKGIMQRGWKNINNNWYYLRDDGGMKTGWLKDKENWYYLRDDGQMKTGWLLDKDQWHYLKSDGTMKIGWQLINNNWYYFNQDGNMAHDTIIDNWEINSDGVAINKKVQENI